jgi:Sulfotransferase family
MCEPNFFIVGAPKAGTSSLYHYLDQHPDIYMSPIKEPCYFSLESRPENFVPYLRARGERTERETHEYLQGPMDRKLSGGIVREWDDYRRLFAHVSGERAVGEASVAYLWSKTAAAGIAERFPEARILMVLRSPADRAFSQYLHALSDCHISQSFREYVKASLRHSGEGMGIHEPFLEMGFYAEQVQRYLKYFPRDQIGIWFYEETLVRPREFMREVLEFLGVDPEFEPDTSTRYHEPRIARLVKPNQMLQRLRVVEMCRRITPAPIKSLLRRVVYRPKGSVQMLQEDRALMLDFYRSDIHRLEEILGRDLGAWLV